MYNPGVNKVKLIIVFLLSVSISVEGFYLLSNIYYLIFIAKSALFFVFVNTEWKNCEWKLCEWKNSRNIVKFEKILLVLKL